MSDSKLIRKFIGKKVRFDEHGGGYIWGDHPGDGEQMIAQVENAARSNGLQISVRGWGAIQNMFPTAKASGEFQNDLGRWIAEAINEKLVRERVSVCEDTDRGGKEESFQKLDPTQLDQDKLRDISAEVEKKIELSPEQLRERWIQDMIQFQGSLTFEDWMKWYSGKEASNG